MRNLEVVHDIPLGNLLVAVVDRTQEVRSSAVADHTESGRTASLEARHVLVHDDSKNQGDWFALAQPTRAIRVCTDFTPTWVIPSSFVL